ncbi:MAG: DNA helicase [Desulfobacteraceae bacterium 4572_35.1]|nr:MAG: DNA helicase [Desulfobacteraceae bacterium 4572_35.1]
MNSIVKVAISSDFFTSFSRLPKVQQGKVSKFITNFQKNPRNHSVNYEKIMDAADLNMRSVRIDNTYRGIVLKPKAGNVYVLLWVDHHDEAYLWAKRHRCDINSQTGAIQIFESQIQIDIVEKTSDEKVTTLFDNLKDRELMHIGVPEALLPQVRKIESENDLDRASDKLPIEAYEGLFLFLAGASYEEVIKEQELVLTTEVDTNDFSAALERMTSRSSFVVVANELELAEMLSAPLDRWRVFLHPSQRRLVEGDKNGAVRVLGGAGTGKTVVAMHRAKWLAKNSCDENQKILFTTFTRNLAIDIAANLAAICSAEEMAKIEVVNLDRWVGQYLRQRKYDYEIIYPNDGKGYWGKALDLMHLELNLPEVFYQEEWQKVIQPQSIETLEQYKRATRLGRGTRLGRADRIKVWPVFEEYRNLLTQNRKREVDDAYRDVSALLREGNAVLPYVAVLVDEAQDMSTQAFNLIRNLVPEGKNDLFIVGDGHQRIYGRNKVVLSHCGINIRGRSRKLKINYRTTEEIRKLAVSLLNGCLIDDLDGGSDDNKAFRSLTHGTPPLFEQFSDSQEQADFIVEYLKNCQAAEKLLSQLCIVARTKYELQDVKEALDANGINYVQIQPDHSDHGDVDAVRLATMHRVKGLEFEEVILASVNDRLCPLAKNVEGRGDGVEIVLADLVRQSYWNSYCYARLYRRNNAEYHFWS